jgi:Ser/Thr protein kinase RdoA (MazF antagonist)
MDSRIERILAQFPELNGTNPVVTPLIGGITNQNYRVDAGGESFVLRIGGKGTTCLASTGSGKASAPPSLPR